MAKPEAKRLKITTINTILPPEMIEQILKLLNIKEICQARVICKRWKESIDTSNLLKKAAGKMFEPFRFDVKPMTYLFLNYGFFL